MTWASVLQHKRPDDRCDQDHGVLPPLNGCGCGANVVGEVRGQIDVALDGEPGAECADEKKADGQQRLMQVGGDGKHCTNAPKAKRLQASW